jgi:PAS domain S-box-containing protein
VARWRRALAAGQPAEAEARLRRHDGEYRCLLLRANPLRDAAGRIAKWYCVSTDIEDRKRSEDALRRNEAFLLDIQRLSRFGAWRFNVATGVIEYSPEIHRAYGVQPGDDVASAAFWFSRIHPDDRERVQAEFERCEREAAPYQAAYRIVLPGGGIRYHHSSGHPVVNDDGQTEFLGAVIDMTEEWETASELERASEALRELQARMASAAQAATMAEFAASVAHEVNQPLSGIITNASTCLRMLDARPPNMEGARETARRMLRDGNRAADVIARLRALFGKQEVAAEPLDLNEAILEVAALCAAELQKRRVTLRTELADDLPMVAGDRVQLQQVVQNLILNAVDAMADMGDRPRRLLIRTEREDGARVRTTVRDNGRGVDPAAVDNLFDAFYTTRGGGMGVGLSVSRSIVERHRGRIWAEANDGPGSTFAFSIPAGPDHADERQ